MRPLLEPLICIAAPPHERLEGRWFEGVPGSEGPWVQRWVEQGGPLGIVPGAPSPGDGWQRAWQDVKLRGDDYPPWGGALLDFLECLEESPPMGSGTHLWGQVWEAALGVARPLGERALVDAMPIPPTLTLTETAWHDLGSSLFARLQSGTARALQPESIALAACGIHVLPGDSQAWLDRLCDLPGLAFVVGTLVRQWQDSVVELVTHCQQDVAELTEVMSWGNVPSHITSLRCYAGDPHSGGRSVSIIAFGQGQRAVHKPKNQVHQLVWQRLLAELSEVDALRSAGVSFGIRSVLQKDGYGWDAFVEADPPRRTSVAEATSWLRSFGAQVRLGEILGMRDMWFDNLVTAGGLPCFVDLETVLQPHLDTPAEADLLAHETSLLTSMISAPLHLPGGMREDLGCLREPAAVHLPFTREDLGLGDKSQFSEAGWLTWQPDPWRPQFPTQLDAAAELLVGYRAVDALRWDTDVRLSISRAITAMASQPVRVVMRSTFACYLILADSLRPELLDDGRSRALAMATLLASAEAENGPGDLMRPVVAAEVAAFTIMDVPYVRADPTTGNLLTELGTWITGFAPPPMAAAHQRLDSDSTTGLREQVVSILVGAALDDHEDSYDRSRAALIRAFESAGLTPDEAGRVVDSRRA